MEAGVKTNAWHEGWSWAARGGSGLSNPYMRASPYWADWKQGWLDWHAANRLLLR